MKFKNSEFNESNFLSLQYIDTHPNLDYNHPVWRIYFQTESSLTAIDSKLSGLTLTEKETAPCKYLPIAIEKALVSKSLALGKKWGLSFYENCKENKNSLKNIYFFAVILHLLEEEEKKREILEFLQSQKLKPYLQKKVEKLIK